MCFAVVLHLRTRLCLSLLQLVLPICPLWFLFANHLPDQLPLCFKNSAPLLWLNRSQSWGEGFEMQFASQSCYSGENVTSLLCLELLILFWTLKTSSAALIIPKFDYCFDFTPLSCRLFLSPWLEEKFCRALGQFPSSIPAPNAAFNYLGNPSMRETGRSLVKGKVRHRGHSVKNAESGLPVCSVVGIWAMQTDGFLCEWVIAYVSPPEIPVHQGWCWNCSHTNSPWSCVGPSGNHLFAAFDEKLWHEPQCQGGDTLMLLLSDSAHTQCLETAQEKIKKNQD